MMNIALPRRERNRETWRPAATDEGNTERHHERCDTNGDNECREPRWHGSRASSRSRDTPVGVARRLRDSHVRYGWCWVSGTLPDGNDVEPGCVFRFEVKIPAHGREPEPTESPNDALLDAEGNMVCRVKSLGETVECGCKYATRDYEVLWLADAERTLHEFSLWCVEQVLCLMADPRSFAALNAKRDWLAGKITDDELGAAVAAARAAVRTVPAEEWSFSRDSAAKAATWAAGSWMSAQTAGSVALGAAEAAMHAALERASEDQPESSDREEVLDAATDRAWDAARTAQSEHLVLLISKLEPGSSAGGH